MNKIAKLIGHALFVVLLLMIALSINWVFYKKAQREQVKSDVQTDQLVEETTTMNNPTDPTEIALNKIGFSMSNSVKVSVK